MDKLNNKDDEKQEGWQGGRDHRFLSQKNRKIVCRQLIKIPCDGNDSRSLCKAFPSLQM